MWLILTLTLKACGHLDRISHISIVWAELIKISGSGYHLLALNIIDCWLMSLNLMLRSSSESVLRDLVTRNLHIFQSLNSRLIDRFISLITQRLENEMNFNWRLFCRLFQSLKVTIFKTRESCQWEIFNVADPWHRDYIFLFQLHRVAVMG